MTISFIIPVYNTEEYIEKCLLSIINQNIPTGEYEIIVVDDGSTDGSPQILANFEQKYSQIKLITQKNRGLGAARNVALRQAQGDYIFFVDSDDYILPNTMLPFLEFINENSDTDIICFNTFKEINGVLKVGVNRSFFKEDKILGERYLTQYNLSSGSCNSLFRRSFLLDYSIFMPEGIFHEDEIFSLKAYVYARVIRFYNHFIYVYLKRKGSIRIPKSLEEEIKLTDDLRYVVRELHSFLKEENLNHLQRIGVKRRLNALVVEIIIKLGKLPFQGDYCVKTFDELIDLNLFPLPARPESWKYEIFRFFFRTKNRALFVLKLRLIRFYRF